MKKFLIVILVLSASLSTYAATMLSCVENSTFTMAEEEMRIYQQGSLLVVEQPKEGPVQIISALGRCVYQSNDARIQVQLQPGIYMIHTTTKTVKFVVR